MDGSGNVANVARVFNVVGFAGSLRRGSYNRALLRTATEVAPPTLHIDIHELYGIPCTTALGWAESVPRKKPPRKTYYFPKSCCRACLISCSEWSS